MAKRRSNSSNPSTGSGDADATRAEAASAATADGPYAADSAFDSHQRLAREVLHVCDSIGTFIEWWGFKAIHGRIWTLLALHREPMSQVEIAEFLGVSRSLISTSIAELAELDLVRPTEAHRNAPYVANMDIWPVVSEVLRKREWMMMERTRVSLEGAIQQAHDDERRGGGASRFDPERMQVLLNMTEMAQSLLRLLMTIRVPKAGGSMLGWLAKTSKLISWFRGENPSALPDDLPSSSDKPDEPAGA